MSTFYVRKTGSDVAAGTTAGAAWLTIDKAANTVVAGDTVYVGAGVYRELVTMDTAGSSGSQISYIADVTGAYTGDAGLVIITAHDNDAGRAARAGCWDMNRKEFITVRGFIMIGTSAASSFVIGSSSAASNLAYEGCIIEQCAIMALGGTSSDRNAYGIVLTLGTGATPATNGAIIRRCRIWGTRGVGIDYTGNAVANINAKIEIQDCEFIGAVSTTSISIAITGTATTFSVGGINIRGCTFIGADTGVQGQRCFNTTNIIGIYNSLFIGVATGINQTLGTSGALVSGANRFTDVATLLSGVTAAHDSYAVGTWLPGLMASFIHETYFGWTPYRQLEAVQNLGIAYTDPSIDAGAVAYATTSVDAYGNSRTMGRPSAMGRLYYMDASDDAVTDPNAVWINEASGADSDPTTAATCTTTGSTSSNFTFAGGTNAPGSGFNIISVRARVFGTVSVGTVTGEAKIYTDALGELLGTINWNNTVVGVSAWATLTVPSGGWTLAKVQALEYKVYKSAGTGTVSFFQLQIGVVSDEIAPDVGAVESNTQPTQNSTDEYEGTYCMELSGAGHFTFWQPVEAASTTITVQAKYDSNYVGTKPQLIVTEIPGVADQTDTVAGASGSYELLSLNFTPTSAGFVRVKLVSNDTSATGKAFFDDLQVS